LGDSPGGQPARIDPLGLGELDELGNTRLTCGHAAVPSEEVTQPKVVNLFRRAANRIFRAAQLVDHLRVPG